MREILSKYGKVEQCEQIGDEYHVKITDGFSIKARNTFEVMQVIIDKLPDFPTVKRCSTDNNLFYFILTK